MDYATVISVILLISPLLFFLTAVVSRFQSGIRPVLPNALSFYASVVGLIASLAGIAGLYLMGPIRSGLPEISGPGLGIRLDQLSLLMYTMISLLVFIILKFSKNYMDGDARHGTFTGRLAATIASVQLLVLSGNLAFLFVTWVLTSMSLQRLLTFYPERPGVMLATRKKFIVARLADLSLLMAVVLLYSHFRTGDLHYIFDEIKTMGGNISLSVEIAASLLALAAIFKSAQFPAHGWLIEVVETPTPVSALLHAGILNAGPFLMVRMAYVINDAAVAPLLLILVGGFTAFFASVTFLTQPSVKTSLGYSSVAHMGFMLMVCGLGVYPAAMLHLVAHSFYKAHAFLSSGSTMESLRASAIKPPERFGSYYRILAGVGFAFGVYIGAAMLWGVDPSEELALLATGFIVVMGLSQIMAPAIDSNAYTASMIRAGVLTLAVAASFFTLESATHHLLHLQVPELSKPGLVKTLLIGFFLLLFGFTVMVQIIAPATHPRPFWQKMGVHFRNGLYVNALFDRFIEDFYAKKINNKKNANHFSMAENWNDQHGQFRMYQS